MEITYNTTEKVEIKYIVKSDYTYMDSIDFTLEEYEKLKEGDIEKIIEDKYNA